SLPALPRECGCVVVDNEGFIAPQGSAQVKLFQGHYPLCEPRTHGDPPSAGLRRSATIRGYCFRQLLHVSNVQEAFSMERTLVLLKPDCVQRRLMGEVISRFERKGLNIVAMKMLQVTPELSKQHYAEHVAKPFYPNLESFITASPIV